MPFVVPHHVNERARRGLGDDYLFDFGAAGETSPVADADLYEGVDPTFVGPVIPAVVSPEVIQAAAGQASVTAPFLTAEWMEKEMIPGFKNKYLVVGVAGVFLVTALSKKRRR